VNFEAAGRAGAMSAVKRFVNVTAKKANLGLYSQLAFLKDEKSFKK
jgi:hypothetical protein